MQNTTKRPLLLFGNIILLLLSLLYIFSQIINFNSPLIFGGFIIVFIFLVMGIKSVNLSKKEFKKNKWFSWIAIILFFVYDVYEYTLLIDDYNKSGYIDVFKIAILFITLFASIISIFGILTRVIDNKITYEEHIRNTKK